MNETTEIERKMTMYWLRLMRKHRTLDKAEQKEHSIKKTFKEIHTYLLWTSTITGIKFICASFVLTATVLKKILFYWSSPFPTAELKIVKW